MGPSKTTSSANRHSAALNNFRNRTTKRGLIGARAGFNAAHSVYNGTPDSDRGLRDILSRVVFEHMQDVITLDEGNQLILKDVPGLSHDLICLVAAGGSSMRINNKLIDLPLVCPNENCHLPFALADLPHGKHRKWSETSQEITCPCCSNSYEYQSYKYRVDYPQSNE